MRQLFFFIVSASLSSCAEPKKTTADASPELPTGPPYSGTISDRGAALAGVSLALHWSGETIEFTSADDGTFSGHFPEARADYQVIITGPEGFWGHSTWLLDVGEEGHEDLEYWLPTNLEVERISNALGAPTLSPEISKDLGIVSLLITPGSIVVEDGPGFSIGSASDPVFTIDRDGVPVRSDVLVPSGDTLLLFANVEPQSIAPAEPNAAAAGCKQLAGDSQLLANTALVLAVSCE